MKYKKELFLLLLYSTALFWSSMNPADRFTWWLEVIPGIIGLFIIIATFRNYKLTMLSYTLILIHCVILFIGGHYTYAEMPLFNWLKETFELDRNYYDRLGHFAQGFIPAIIIREILWRSSPLKHSRWMPFLVISTCLAISAVYELVEFAVAIMTGEAAEAFLGTQRDVWDTQWDMLLALIGASVSYLLLQRLHDNQLEKIKTR
ncbi:DUF2238 domain-containing protein [Fictibacillus aquaticus]|uniref:DUF2238 domain-containing protein n=1 Tax=Fictibacillus aquaticus TaxID=2021314 RepID=A0A235F5N0_9BACL|nr:DUF2238 domain-containing protein [Fictibacillus aquaticus]OYD56606.1 hypothetical protein CGZ90_16470 [Fictibacillus aquaticus]